MKKTRTAAYPGLALAGRLEDLLVEEGIPHVFALIHIMLIERADVGDLAALMTMQGSGLGECRIDVPLYYSDVTELGDITCREQISIQIGPDSSNPEGLPAQRHHSHFQASDLRIAVEDLPDFLLAITSHPNTSQDVLVSTVEFNESATVPRISSYSDTSPFDMELIRIQVMNAFKTLTNVGGEKEKVK